MRSFTLHPSTHRVGAGAFPGAASGRDRGALLEVLDFPRKLQRLTASPSAIIQVVTAPHTQNEGQLRLSYKR